MENSELYYFGADVAQKMTRAQAKEFTLLLTRSTVMNNETLFRKSVVELCMKIGVLVPQSVLTGDFQTFKANFLSGMNNALSSK